MEQHFRAPDTPENRRVFDSVGIPYQRMDGSLYLPYDDASYTTLVENNMAIDFVTGNIERSPPFEQKFGTTPAPERLTESVAPPDDSQSYVFRPEKRIQIMIPKCYGTQLCEDYPDTELQESRQDGALEAQVCLKDVDILKVQLKGLGIPFMFLSKPTKGLTKAIYMYNQ